MSADRQIRGTPFMVDTSQEQICVVGLLQDQDGKVRSEMSKKTHTNPLSKREVEQLRSNRSIASVTTSTVRFTEEFKQMAYDRKLRGIPVTETMQQCGIDPEMLGESRVTGFCYQLNKKAKGEHGFSDGRSKNYRRPAKSGEDTVEQRLKQLEHELAYTRQEVEFLKKLQAANSEAQRQWESRHRQK